jgi:methyl-accepting chemotaxis protein
MLRRKNYLIKKRFQFNFLSGFVLLLVLESVFIAGLFMYVSHNTLTTGYFRSTLTIEQTPRFFLISFLLITLIVVLGMGLAGMVIFIVLSHRIAGPLYRVEKVLKEIGLGDFTTRVNLRRTDQLTELKEALNSLLEALDARMGRVKKCVEETQELLAKKNDPEMISELSSALARLRKEIDHFKVTSGPMR